MSRPSITPMKMARTKEIPTLETTPRVLKKSLLLLSISHFLVRRPAIVNQKIVGHYVEGLAVLRHYKLLKALRAQAMVRSISAYEWLMDTNAVSNCDGAK